VFQVHPEHRVLQGRQERQERRLHSRCC
jgi:hypothetical protein